MRAGNESRDKKLKDAKKLTGRETQELPYMHHRTGHNWSIRPYLVLMWGCFF